MSSIVVDNVVKWMILTSRLISSFIGSNVVDKVVKWMSITPNFISSIMGSNSQGLM